MEGILRATEGYAALGDTQMVGLGLRVAERLAARDPEAAGGGSWPRAPWLLVVARGHAAS